MKAELGISNIQAPWHSKLKQLKEFSHTSIKTKMKVSFLLLACAVLGTFAVPDQTWKDFKNKYGKKYGSAADETKARSNFDANDKIIQAHLAQFAAGKVSFTLDHNDLSDLSLSDYQQTRLSLKVDSIKMLRESATGEELRLDSLPEVRQSTSIDYSNTTCMTPVKNQGQCGSCYAFSAVAALEYYNCKKTGVKQILSEQQFVDCSSAYGNGGCNGGFYSNCYDYVMKNSGYVALNSSYPYVAKSQTCKYVSTMKAGNVTNYKWSLPQGDETVMMTTFLAAQGPVNVAVNASLSTFQLYKSGVYSDAKCSTSVDHAVLVVGYGTLNGTNYWKVKNSWGTSWGSSGYMLIQRGVNRCGIAGYVLYPVV